MKTTIQLILLFFCIACSKNQQDKNNEEINTDSPVTTLHNQQEQKKLDIVRFRTQCNTLLQSQKNENYTLKLKSDTFYFHENKEEFTKGHGIFWALYSDSSKRIVRHHLYEPATKEQLRIYLVESEYRSKEHLNRAMTTLNSYRNHEINAPDSEDAIKWDLSPVNDYVMTSDTKLLWLNISYPYSQNQVMQYVDCLKQNVDTTLLKSRILCLVGSDCKTTDLP